MGILYLEILMGVTFRQANHFIISIKVIICVSYVLHIDHFLEIDCITDYK